MKWVQHDTPDLIRAAVTVAIFHIVYHVKICFAQYLITFDSITMTLCPSLLIHQPFSTNANDR